jgi:hypothetical protein
MTKYNVGDILEITEDFVLECASYNEGEKYTITEVGITIYSLESDGYDYANNISEVDAHSGFRKVEPKVEFKVGDKVRLLETAHGSKGYSCDTRERVKERLASTGLDYQTVFEVDQEVDLDGDVHVFHAESYVGLYLLPEFLVPWVEEDKPAAHMELGKTYRSTDNELFYTPTEFDFEAGRVAFVYKGEQDSVVFKSTRPFCFIEEEFGVLPPAKPVGVSQVALDEVEQEEFATAAPEPETVSVDALREAWDYVDHEYPDIEKLIKLAKRLS